MNAFSDQRPVIFGEVLFDRFPDGSVVLGGAPFNVAWHLQAFGMAPLFISRVGDDALGRRIRDTLHAWGMDASGLQLDSAHPTGSVDIRIEDGEPGFDIVDQQAYDYIDPAAIPPLPDCALLYHGSLAVRNAGSGRALQQLQQGRDLQRLVDVNLRPPWWQRDTVMSLLRGARWIKLNEAELALIGGEAYGLQAQMQQLQDRCGAELLIVTRGAAGAVVLASGGEEFRVVPQNQSMVIDTVGAGDAFTSVVTLGLLRGWSVPLMLERAQAFASAITGIRGATCNDPGFYQTFIDNWKLI
ncbi:MAG: carbohydrate kinase [Gammaproteobacteria bacterium]|nr:carbohydrate kinase [Gammaproteobacteria bacterium]